MNSVLLDHFFPPKEQFSAQVRLRPHRMTPLLKTEEIASALSKCSPTSAPGPDGIPYSTWKQVNRINTSILLRTLAPLVSLGHHPTSLKGSNGVVLDKPGKPFSESLSCFRMIVLIRTFSKIVERIIAARLLTAARLKGLLLPNQCGSLPGLSTYDACLTLTYDVKALPRPGLKVSSLFLDIKARFDNVDNNTLARTLREAGIHLTWSPGFRHFLVNGAAPLSPKGPQGPQPPSTSVPPRAPQSPVTLPPLRGPSTLQDPSGSNNLVRE